MHSNVLFVVTQDNRKAKHAFSDVRTALEYVYAFYNLTPVNQAHTQRLIDLLDNSFVKVINHRINIYYN